jgi:hypothetical protein
VGLERRPECKSYLRQKTASWSKLVSRLPKMFPLTKGKGKDLPAEQLPVYRYADLLDKRSFRILELLPGQPHEDISVRLHNAHWDDAPPYDALSYVWGDPNVKNSIICDGQRLDCTPNLISFMKSLRFPPHSGEESSKRERLWPLSRRGGSSGSSSRFLWADAIWYSLPSRITIFNI